MAVMGTLKDLATITTATSTSTTITTTSTNTAATAITPNIMEIPKASSATSTSSSRIASPIAETLEDTEEVTFLPGESGLLLEGWSVKEILPNGQAFKAGVKIGWSIIKVDDI